MTEIEPVTAAEGEEIVYVVERILRHEENEKGEIIKYLVRWRGFTAADDSWVLPEDMMCPIRVERYKEHLAYKRAREKGEKVGGKFHTWLLVKPDDDDDDEKSITVSEEIDLSGSILDAVKDRRRTLHKKDTASEFNVSFTQIYEAENESSDHAISKRMTGDPANQMKNSVNAENSQPNNKKRKRKILSDEELLKFRRNRARVNGKFVKESDLQGKNDEPANQPEILNDNTMLSINESSDVPYTQSSMVQQRSAVMKQQGSAIVEHPLQGPAFGERPPEVPAIVKHLPLAYNLPSIDTFNIFNSQSCSPADPEKMLSSDEIVFVNIGPEMGSPENQSRPGSITSLSTVQNYEVLSGVFLTMSRHLAYSTAPKMWPLTHCLSDTEKEFLRQKLFRIVVGEDLIGLKQILLHYRSSELELNQLYENQTLINMCCTIDCNDYHLPCELIEQLILNGTDPNRPSTIGITPLMIAAARGSCCKLENLLKFGARTDETNFDHENALFMAVRNCPEVKISQTLSTILSHGTNIRCVNNYNQSIFDVGFALQKWHAVDILKEHIKKSECNFMNVIQQSMPQSILSRLLIEFRYLEIVAQRDWRLSLFATKSDFPLGYSHVMFLSGVEFVENNCLKYFSVNDQNFVEIYFNDAILKPDITGRVDVITLKPWIYGENLLIIRNVMPKSVLKLALQGNRMENARYV